MANARTWIGGVALLAAVVVVLGIMWSAMQPDLGPAAPRPDPAPAVAPPVRSNGATAEVRPRSVPIEVPAPDPEVDPEPVAPSSRTVGATRIPRSVGAGRPPPFVSQLTDADFEEVQTAVADLEALLEDAERCGITRFGSSSVEEAGLAIDRAHDFIGLDDPRLTPAIWPLVEHFDGPLRDEMAARGCAP